MLNRFHLYIYYLLKNHGPRAIFEYIRYILYFKLSQDKLLKENYNPSIRRLIIFLTPGFDIVNGGILSISSIYEETKKYIELYHQFL